MVWTVEKEGRVAYLVGTAHFFPYSFSRSFTGLLKKVETAIFEGPLDEESMAQIAAHGRCPEENSSSLADVLEPEAVAEINRQLDRRLNHQNESEFYLLFRPPRPNYVDLYARAVRPWMAFFSIWSTYLGWQYSMDMEAFEIAQNLGKPIHFLETIEEQLVVLDSIPFDRIVRQLYQVKTWPYYSNCYVDLFLQGELDQLLALMDGFASRTRTVVGERDIILFERMKAILQREPAVAFVGFPHIPGVKKLFLDEGYHVTQGVR
jgi:hypothetical protein